ncbi:MAG: hypothetical protein JNM84_26835 [Planctomycetes bacterium]|nr:hypothetical protein [Planctomycetota bacterium]
MITPMRKVALLGLSAERELTLLRLRELGVLHVVAEQVPAGPALDEAKERLRHARAVAVALESKTPPSRAPRRSGAELVRAFEQLQQRKCESERLVQELEAEVRAGEPFGDFDPTSALALEERGLELKLYRGAPEALPRNVPAGSALVVLGESDGQCSVAFFGPREAELPLRRCELPARPLREARTALAAQHTAQAALERELELLRAERAALPSYLAQLEDEVQLLAAQASMGSEAELAWIRGYCPEVQIEALAAAAASHGWALSVREPSASDQPPTLLSGAAWVQQVHGVLRAIGILPGYGEPDVSPLFLVFLVLFAAMLIGDAGYGALILLAVAVVRWRAPRVDRQALRLLTTMGVGTVAWGVITGTWFALQGLPSALQALRIEWLAGADPQQSARNVMLLCFLLGALHLTLAHLWAALRIGWKLPALAQLGWVATTWTMFFAARAMVLGAPFPALGTTLAVLGIAAIALFMTPLRQIKDEWFNHVMLPLSLVSNFVDVVSYLRLFAVGTAGVAVAGAFNEMAARVAESGPLGWLFAALVAIFGHSLNLLLCAMGVLVHGVRLNTLEFSAHLGLQWSGTPYAPLARRRADPGAASEGSVVNTPSSG